MHQNYCSKCKEQEEDKTVYIVFANTHEGGYGAEIEILGVADNEEDRDKIIARAQEEYLDPYSEEIKLNKYGRTYLGRYYE